MSKREVYAERVITIPTLNPFVEFPKMRVDEVNKLNELIERNVALPVAERKYQIDPTDKKYECPVCGRGIVNIEDDNFCRKCGQRLDTENIAL